MHEISLAAERIFFLGSFPVTNALLLAVITLVFLSVIFLLLRRALAVLPSRAQSIAELVLDEALNLMDAVLGHREKSIKYAPLILAVFLFVMISNWLGLLPGVGSIVVKTPEGRAVIEETYGAAPVVERVPEVKNDETVHPGSKEPEESKAHESVVPLLRAPAADLNFTIALAMISVLSVNMLGMIALGARKFSKRYFTLSNPIYTFTGILEFISEFVKIISFSFRLFGNVFAGEVLLMIVGFLVPFVLPLPFLFLEIFVGFIQAFIFSMLTLVFVAMATSEEEAH